MQPIKIVKKFESITQCSDYIEVKTDAINYRIYFLTEDIIRIRSSFDNQFTEESYALVLTAWEDRYDTLLKEERHKVTPLKANIIEEAHLITVTAGNLSLLIKKEPFALGVRDQDGDLIYKDLEDRALVTDHLGRHFHYFEIDKKDAFYGLGETPGSLNKAGKEHALAPKDAIGYDPEFATSMYKHIPFFIKLSKKSNKASGYFYNNFWNSRFNFGAEVSGYWHPYGYFQTDGGDIDLFVMNGPNIPDVVKHYTKLTGKSTFAPLYSLGYLGSTMYYVELPKDCDQEILDFTQQNLKLGIPIDGFQLSSGYTVGEDGKRYVFTWNNTRFKDPKSWFRSMNDLGVMVSPNVKPGILTSHPKYNEFLQHNAFIKDSAGEKPFVGRWWGGTGSFVDFTSQAGRNYWKKELTEQILSQGTSSVWNDNCEYEIEDPLALCDNEGRTGYIGGIRSFQSNLMCYTTQQAIMEYSNANRKDSKKPRPYIVCRSGASGIQRYAQTWAGDNYTSWRSLKHNIATILNMGLSGVANQGADIGGFQGPRPDSELLLRWVQNGIFMPRFSIHSCNTDNTVTEPWMYEDVSDLIKEAITLRYQYMPYLYSLLQQASETGEPILRPLVYQFQTDQETYSQNSDFMFGPALLISNIVEEGESQHRTYLPKGADWYRLTDRKKLTGGETDIQKVTLGSIPTYLAEGGIVPMTRDWHRLQHQPLTWINILFAPGRASEFCWYQDDGKSMDYQKGDYLKTHISMNDSVDKVVIHFKHEGDFVSSVEALNLELVNINKGGYWVKLNELSLPQLIDPEKFDKSSSGWRYDATSKSLKIKYPYQQEDYTITASFEPFDLIGMSNTEADF